MNLVLNSIHHYALFYVFELVNFTRLLTWFWWTGHDMTNQTLSPTKSGTAKLGSRWAVLVVDDERDAAAEMKDMIEQSSYRVFAAHSVPEAREYLAHHPDIGVVICDVRMPGPTGLEFLKELSAREGKDAIRTIIVTGYASYDKVVDALRNRAFDFLSKPLTRAILMARVDDALSEIEILRANDSVDSTALKNILRKRETRITLFRDLEYSEAAWDILIELTVARLDGRRLDVSGLCLLTHVSRTTAWRTIQSLVNAGMLVRVEDPDDRRRIHVELVDHVFETVRDFACTGAI